jgi:streptogramin lyase
MRMIRPLLVAMALVAVPAGPAFAVPKVDGVFALPGVQTNGQLTVGPDGNVWVSLEQAVGKVKPDGSATELTTGGLSSQLGFPTGGITSAGGFIWVSQGPGAGLETIVKIPPGNPAGAQGVAVPGVTTGSTAMTTGPDGNVWVGLAGKLVKFPPANPAAATPYAVPGLAPKALISATDGTLWVTDTDNGGRLLNVTTQGAVTSYTVGGQPQFAGAGPGGQVVFSNPNNSPQQIGRLVPGGLPLTIDRPNGSDPEGVTFGADGAFWIAEFAGNRLARMTPGGQLTTLGGLPVVSNQGPRQITAGPGNTLWATLDKPGDTGASQIARITGVDPPVVPPAGTPTGAPGGGSPPADTAPPVLTAARLSKASFAAGAAAATFRFTSSEPGAARLVLSRRLAGRRRGTACLKPTRSLRRAKRCTRSVRVRTISFAATAGANAVRIPVRSLAAGSYGATLTVVDAAGNTTAPVTRTFTVTRRARRR